MGSLVLGKIRGNMWYVGDGITGSSTTPAVFPDSGVSKAYVGDMYLHLESADDDNGHVYQCTLKGDAETAKWVYTGSILGPMPELCDDLDSTSITKAATANAIRRLKDLIDNAGIYPLAMDFNYDEEAYSTTLTIENVSTTISITDSDGNVGTYSYTASGSTEEANVTINIGEDIGYESEGAIVTHIASSVAVIKNAKLYGSDGLICDITPDMWGAVNDLNAEIKPGATISGGSGADAYSYRAGNIFKKIGGVITQLFPVTHAKAVWMDKVNGNTVHHEITSTQNKLDTTIGDLADHILTGTKPDTQIDAGEFFVDKDNAFRIANSNISTATDIDNTNSTVKTVGEVLTELNSKTTQSIYETITLNNDAGNTVTFYKVGRVVQVAINIGGLELPSDLTLLDVIPEDYKPAIDSIVVVNYGGGNITSALNFLANGSIHTYATVCRYSAGSSSYISQS